jgi:DNA-binding NarL/FixJ family response regulator
MIRICINDDQTLFRETLARMLGAQPGVEVAGEAGDGEEAVRQAIRLKPDLVLMDIGMPKMDGLEATRRLKLASPGVRVVALTMHTTEDIFRRALAAGVDSFILKDARIDDLMATIRLTQAGTHTFNGNLLRSFVERRREVHDAHRLTARELQVLQLVAEGYSNRNLAAKLAMSEKTVRNHVSNIYAKLGVKRRSQAVLYAIRNGLAAAGQGASVGLEGG